MQILCLVWGILAVVGMFVGFFPCLGALNWLNIPFSIVGLAISVIALTTTKEPSKGGSIAGVVCCSLAAFFGLIRLVLGAGVV